jgi:hypothetical protein
MAVAGVVSAPAVLLKAWAIVLKPVKHMINMINVIMNDVIGRFLAFFAACSAAL